MQSASPRVAKGPSERLLAIFSDVRAGETPSLLLLFANLFLILVGYYVIKTVREPLILASGGAELKSYAAAAQAVVLVGFIPLYSWLSSRLSRLALITSMTVFFVLSIELFYVGAAYALPHLGFVFYVWVGIFSVTIIAQFWSYANDLYTRDAGERLFPIIALGATLGAPLGSLLAKELFELGVGAYDMLQVTVLILLGHLAIYWLVERRGQGNRGANGASSWTDGEKLARSNGFALVFRSRYIRLIALLLILLNLVNTTGEYILGSTVVDAAKAAAANDASVDVGAYIGAFYGDFYFVVNMVAIGLQALVVSRLVKVAGIAGVLFALPVVAMGAYGVMALGAGMVAMRWVKTAENSTDYSVMNTAKAMLWLPTSREEKYKAKQTVDTFFVRLGDVISAVLVFAGTEWLAFGVRSFAATNLVIVALWFVVAGLLVREYRRLADLRGAETGDILGASSAR